MNNKLKYILIPLLLIVAGIIYFKFPITQSQKLNKQCQEFGKDFIEQNKIKDIFAKNSITDFFYSNRLDTCVMTNIDELGNEYGIYDIKRNFIKQELEDIRLMASIFYCDRDGVDNVILEKAEKYGGKLFTVPYKEYLDNGEGGEPRTLKTPEKEYTRDNCQRLFNEKIKEIK